MKVVVLGGAGKMGSVSVQDLVMNRRVEEVVIADKNLAAAQEVASYLNSSKVHIVEVDLADQAHLVSVLRGADACVNATVYYTNLAVMAACLEAGTPYTDMGGLFHVTRQQLKLHERFVEAGISAVLGMGTAPGLPNIQARYAAERLDSIDSIRIYDGIRPPASDVLEFGYAVPTILDELTLSPVVYRDGQFVECAPLSELEDYWFTPPLGRLPMHLSLHSEVATLPISFAAKGVRECFFKINYWGMTPAVVERLSTLAELGFASSDPVILDGTAVKPRDLLTSLMNKYVLPLTAFLAPATRQPPDWVKELVTEVKGTKDGQPVTYRLGTLTCKGAAPTGTVPARGAVWQAEGRIPAGVHPPELVIDPVPFLKELEDREIFTQVTVTHLL